MGRTEERQRGCECLKVLRPSSATERQEIRSVGSKRTGMSVSGSNQILAPFYPARGLGNQFRVEERGVRLLRFALEVPFNVPTTYDQLPT